MSREKDLLGTKVDEALNEAFKKRLPLTSFEARMWVERIKKNKKRPVKKSKKYPK